MGLFLPLVVYMASRKKYGDWPANPYIVEKRKFLNDAKQSLTPVYERIRDHVPDGVTFGEGKPPSNLDIVEIHLTKKPLLTSQELRNNCTLLVANPRDLLRTKREIENDLQTLDSAIINKAVQDEIRAIETFLGSYTPFIFVPGFSFKPYQEPFSDKPHEIVSKYQTFFEDNMGQLKDGQLKFMSYSKDGLIDVGFELMHLQEIARDHITEKLGKLKKAAEKRIF